MTGLQVHKTQAELQLLVDEFDTKNMNRENLIGQSIIANMVLTSHYFISNYGNITEEIENSFSRYFPLLNREEYYFLALEFLLYYLGNDVNSLFYKINLNKWKAIYNSYSK